MPGLNASSRQFFLAPRGVCTGIDQLAGGAEGVRGVGCFYWVVPMRLWAA